MRVPSAANCYVYLRLLGHPAAPFAGCPEPYALGAARGLAVRRRRVAQRG